MIKQLGSANGRIRKRVASRFAEKAREIEKYAKRVAPKQSGQLSNKIYSRTYSNEMRATVGIAPTISRSGFDYSQFVTGNVKISVAEPNKFFQQGQTVRYGFPAAAPSGSLVQWTASPRWWEGVEKRANRSFPQVARIAVEEVTEEINKS